MLNLVEISLNNNYIYISIITLLVIIIILTIISIKKDRDMEYKMRMEKNKPVNEEEQAKAKLELEKVIDEMQKNVEKENIPTDEIKTYEEDQEKRAIISYQELVDAVKNGEGSKAHSEVGMEVASLAPIEEMEKIKDDDIIDFGTNEVKKEPEPVNTKPFKTSEYISPVYGKTSDTEDDKFLDSLKDFRKNL